MSEMSEVRETNQSGAPASQPVATENVRDYVARAADVLGLNLDDAAIARAAEHFARTTALAAVLETVKLDDDVEAASIYSPAPFPAPFAEQA